MSPCLSALGLHPRPQYPRRRLRPSPLRPPGTGSLARRLRRRRQTTDGPSAGDVAPSPGSAYPGARPCPGRRSRRAQRGHPGHGRAPGWRDSAGEGDRKGSGSRTQVDAPCSPRPRTTRGSWRRSSATRGWSRRRRSRCALCSGCRSAGKSRGCDLSRHTMATLMLAGRRLQSSLEVTECDTLSRSSTGKTRAGTSAA